LEEVLKIIADEESHFLDFKSKDITGKRLQKSVVAFANADGGEILVRVNDPKSSARASIDRWNGFKIQEEANPLVQTISQDITPYPPVEFEFYEIDGFRDKGLALKIKHPTIKGGVCFRLHPGLREFRNGPISAAQIPLIGVIETPLSVSPEIP
jgi:predicted HTH transcriptional regulator